MARKMKDSGIEWIGEIPEGWEIIPVKYLAKYNYATLAESCSPDFEFSYIDIGSVTYTDGITNYQNFKFKDAPSRARRIVHSGDILVSTVRTYLRAVACVNEHRLPQIASTGFLVLQADTSKFIRTFLCILFYQIILFVKLKPILSESAILLLTLPKLYISSFQFLNYPSNFCLSLILTDSVLRLMLYSLKSF